MKKTSSQVPTLKNGATKALSNINKASLLNEVFSQNFNDAIPRLSGLDYQCLIADLHHHHLTISFALNRRVSIY